MRPGDYTVKFLAELLMRTKCLTREQAQSCLSKEHAIRLRIEKEQGARGIKSANIHYSVSPAEVIAHMELTTPEGKTLDEDRIMQVIAKHAGKPWRKIDPLKLDADLIASTTAMPFAKRHVCLPLERRGLRLVVAVDDPYNTTLFQMLRDVTQHEIELVVSAKGDILKSLTEIHGFKKAVKFADEELSKGVDIGNLEQFVQLSNVDELDSEDRHVVRAVEYIFHYAFDQRASDIHIEPRRETSMIRMRIDGVLHDIYALPRQVHLAMTSRIKMLARMDISGAPQTAGRAHQDRV